MGVQLETREGAILLALVDNFILTGEPVGSRTLSKINALGLSAASIRNVMSDLTEQGFLEQPHTSAGRVPSDKAYRYYVDARAGEVPLAAEIRDAIDEVLGDFSGGLEQLLAITTRLLAELTQFTGVVASPHMETTRLKMLEFLRVNPQQVFVVLITQSNMVYSKILRVSEDLSQEFLNSVSRYLNEHFLSKSLVDIRRQVLDSLAEEKEQYDQLLAQVARLSKRAFDLSDARELYVEGQSNIVKDLHDVRRIGSLLQALEEKFDIIALLDQTLTETGVNISIGMENKLACLEGCSVLTAQYGERDNSLGALAVIGPTRMNYQRVIPIVEYAARALTQAIANHQ